MKEPRAVDLGDMVHSTSLTQKGSFAAQKDMDDQYEQIMLKIKKRRGRRVQNIWIKMIKA